MDMDEAVSEGRLVDIGDVGLYVVRTSWRRTRPTCGSCATSSPATRPTPADQGRISARCSSRASYDPPWPPPRGEPPPHEPAGSRYEKGRMASFGHDLPSARSSLALPCG